MSYGGPSPFPPSFEGNPLAYGFGLFGDVVVASLSLAILLAFLFEQRRRDAALRMLGQRAQLPPGAHSALTLYRIKHICIWSFVVLRSLPDALWMTLWGEVSRPTIEILLAVDLLADGLAVVPFGAAVILWAWGKQVVEQTLIDKNAYVSGRAPWEIIRQNLAIIGLVLLIAAGVTIGKASG